MTETVEPKAWPLGGYAPGNYSCICGACQKEFVGDKRAWQCLECAAISVKSALTRSDPAVRDRVKPLEWEDCTSGDLGHCADTIIGRYWVQEDSLASSSFEVVRITIEHESEAYACICRGHTLESGKAAAQADYEQRILSALELRTSPPEPASGLPSRAEAQQAAALLMRCNGHDLDVWTEGEWPSDVEFLDVLSRTPPAKEPQ